MKIMNWRCTITIAKPLNTITNLHLLQLKIKQGFFKKDFLKKVDSLTNELAKLQYVQRVTSPTNLKTLSLGGLVPMQTSVMHF